MGLSSISEPLQRLKIQKKKIPGVRGSFRDIEAILKIRSFESSTGFNQPDQIKRYWNERPQPQDLTALGLLKVNPERSRLEYQSRVVPSSSRALFLSTTT